MALENLDMQLQVKLIEFAWEAAKKLNGANPSVNAYGRTFGEVLDQFARSCEAAGKDEKP